MKLFYFFDNEKDIVKLKDIFESSIPDDLIPHPSSFQSTLCQKHHGGGYEGWLRKYSTIMIGFDKTARDEYFIFSDIDVRFYKTIKIDLQKDMYFQTEVPNKNIANIGFMIIKNCEQTLNFWKQVYDKIEELKYIDDHGCYKIKHSKGNGAGQFVVNDLLHNNEQLNWDLLPLHFWSKSIGFDYLDKNIILHHANACYGIQKKIDQLIYISQIVQRLYNE
jgi:hypothetical protein